MKVATMIRLLVVMIISLSLDCRPQMKGVAEHDYYKHLLSLFKIHGFP